MAAIQRTGRSNLTAVAAADLFRTIIDSPVLAFPATNPLTDAMDDAKVSSIGARLDHIPPRPRKAALYVHIPFCATHCTFCLYNARVAKSHNPAVVRYLDALTREIEYYAAKPYVRELDFRCVYIGGGTPTTLDETQLDSLLGLLRSRFDLSRCEEYTVEISLHTVTEGKLAACKGRGATRVSFGWQTFAPHVRKIAALGPTEDDLRKWIHEIKRAGFSVNTDLIYGMPLQTAVDWETDMSRALELGITSVDMFKCELFPPAPLYFMTRKNGYHVASAEDRCKMLRHAVKALKNEGWVQSNYQHLFHPNEPTSNVLYNTYAQSSSYDLLGLGAGAQGVLADWSYMSTRSIEPYCERWTSSASAAPAMSCALEMTDARWRERDLVLGFPWALRVEKALLGGHLSDYEERAIKSFLEHGLIIETDDAYQLTDEAIGYAFNMSHALMSKEERRRTFAFMSSLQAETRAPDVARTDLVREHTP